MTSPSSGRGSLAGLSPWRPLLASPVVFFVLLLTYLVLKLPKDPNMDLLVLTHNPKFHFHDLVGGV